MPKYKLMRLWWFLLLPFSFILTSWAKQNPQGVEDIYSTAIYPVISSGISILSGFANFSLAEVIIVFSIVFFFFYIVLFIMKIAQLHKEKRRYQIYLLFVNIGIVITVLVFLFNVLCGLNYYRIRPAEAMGLDVSSVTEDQIYEMASQLVNDANMLRQEVEQAEDGTMKLSLSKEETLFQSQRIMNNLSQTSDLKRLSGSYSQPKGVRFSGVLSAFGINGFFFPYTYEANINMDLPDYMIPSSMIHEQIHVRGYMREDDTNFITYLCAMQSGDSTFQYSATMMVLEHSIYLMEAAGDPRAEILIDALSPEVIKDMEAGQQYHKDHQGVFFFIGQMVSNTFLKFSNQEKGVATYQEVVRMVAAYYQEDEISNEI